MKPDRYEKRVIAYIDLLGFKDFIHYTSKTSNNPSGKLKEVYTFFEFLRSVLNLENKYNYVSETKVISHFSDLIVISFSAADHESFYDELRDIQFIIANCLTHGFFVRGSVVYGDLIHTPEIIFGPGLVEAYELEKSVSKYPRVIVDETIVRDFNDIKPVPFPIEDIVSMDNDGHYFIDYFVKVKDKLDDQIEYKKYIKSMTDLLFQMSKKPNLKEKADWIWPYYHQMLININFINRDELLDFEIDDLWHIKQTMDVEWIIDYKK